MLNIRYVVDRHEQKYQKSCSPSLIEMLLKIHEKVPLNYYDLQHKYKDQNIGLIYFRNQEIEGLTIHCHDESKGQSFPDRLRELLREGQIVALYCKNNDGSVHGWLVNEIRESENKVYLLSKLSELGNGEGNQTIQAEFHLLGANSIQITDLIYGSCSNV